MARLGRGQPFPPKLAKPIVGPQVPYISRPYIVSAVQVTAFSFYHLSQKVKLAKAVVTTTAIPPIVTRPFIVSAVQENAQRITRYRPLRVRYAAPITERIAPLWTRAFFISSVRQNRERFLQGLLLHPLLAPPIFNPVSTLGVSDDWTAQNRGSEWKAMNRGPNWNTNKHVN